MSFSCVSSCREPSVLQSPFCGFPFLSACHGTFGSGTVLLCRGRKFAGSNTHTLQVRKIVSWTTFGGLRSKRVTGAGRGKSWSWDTVVLSRAQSSAVDASEGREAGRRAHANMYDSSVDLGDEGDHKIEFSDKHIAGNPLTPPSCGEIFLKHALERQKLRADRQTAAKEPMQRHDTRKRDKAKILKAPEASCYGCGAGLQCFDSEAPGFVSSDIFELKRKHRQLKEVLCGRCRLLSQGLMIPAVGGHGGYGDGKGFVSAEELRSQLSHLRNNKALIVKLVDIVDFNGSFLTRVRDLVGANPIILVATKIDLLPKGTDLSVVGDWVVESVLRKKLNVKGRSRKLGWIFSRNGPIYVCSACRTVPGGAFDPGRDVYVLGSANVGKSAFISALLKEMSSRDPVALAARRRKPIQSAMPGTTLGPIEIKAFSGGGSLHDTPGVHLHHRMAAAVHPDDLPQIAPRRRLCGSVALAPSLCVTDGEANRPVNVEGDLSDVLGQGPDKTEPFKKKSIRFDGKGTLAGSSLFWGGLVRIDIVQAPTGARLRFYGPASLQVIMVPTAEADDFYAEEVGKTLCPPTGLDRLASWSGLPTQHTVLVTLKNGYMPAGDVAISGLGWITVEYLNVEAFMVTRKGDEGRLAGHVQMLVHVPRAVEVYSRPPMPVGVDAPEWYKYSDISDQDLDHRPRFFF